MKRICSVIVIVILALVLVACASNGVDEKADTNGTFGHNSSGKFELIEEKDVDYSALRGILPHIKIGFGEYCTYALYDMDNNGIRDMIVKTGTYEAEFIYHFYYMDEKGNPCGIGEIDASHSVLYANEEGPGIICVSGYQGFQTVRLIEVSQVGSTPSIVSTTILEGDIGDGDYYKNDSPLSICYITDEYLFEKGAQLLRKELNYNFDSLDPEIGESDNVPYVPYTFGVLGWSLSAYHSQEGGVCVDISDKLLSSYYVLNQLDNTSYYNCNGDIVAVQSDEIVALAFVPEASRFGTYSSTPSIRDVINSLEATEMFNVCPETLPAEKDPLLFHVWKVDNGYVGIKSVGSADQQALYSNSALLVVLFSDKALCSAYN